VATERIFEGRHLEDALAAAAEATGVPAADLHYRIVEQGRRGLFGLGARSVRIRVEDASPVGLEPPAPPPRARPPRQEPRAPRAMAQQPEPNATSRAAAADTLQRMIDLMGLDVQVRAEPSENGLDVVLSGGDRAALAQNDAELRSALQFLINRMARRSWPDVGRIQLTLEGGRAGRDAEFIERIRGVAAQVARTGTPLRLPPMNAYERRIVHLTVREFTELGSRSDGNGHLKRVSIFKQGGS
jgi:spoIIIJ-associated protein